MPESTILQLLVSVALGLLVGFQREWTAPHVAGLRTFAVITLLGTLTGMLVEQAGGWVVAAGFLAVAALLVVRYQREPRTRKDAPGLTTMAVALLMYAVGVSVVLLGLAVAIVVTGAAAALLHWKGPLHRAVKRTEQADVRAVFQLVLIGLVILPMLPNRSYGPYDVLNPFEIWLMVVLICGISVAGFLVHKFRGARAGTLVGGILGGVISSTATTVSYARRTRSHPATSGTAAAVILIASCVVFGRVLLEVAAVAPSVLPDVGGPLAATMGVAAAVAAAGYLRRGGDDAAAGAGGDPIELKPALLFGLLYAVVLFGVAAARRHFGSWGLYTVAVLSGLTDMDAITLSAATMIRAGKVDPGTGWRMILVGAMANLAFKLGVVMLLGHRSLRARTAALFGLALAGAALVFWLWP